MNRFAYSFEELRDHLAALEFVRDYETVTLADGSMVELNPADSLECMVPRVMDYMKQIYRDKNEAVFKGVRFLMMLQHALADLEMLEAYGYATISDKENHPDEPSLIDGRIWMALLHFYVELPFRDEKVTVGELIAYAKALPLTEQ